MTNTLIRALFACALLFVPIACSRSTSSQPESGGPAMTPAADVQRPPSRLDRPGCRRNFALFDADGDGRVSRVEFDARPHAHPQPEAVFRSRDRSGDGSLTEDEFCSGWRPGAPAGRGPKPGSAMGPRAGPPQGGPNCGRSFEAFDSDGNGVVTETEFARWPHARGDATSLFRARDRDGDGSITRTEFCSEWPSPAR